MDQPNLSVQAVDVTMEYWKHLLYVRPQCHRVPSYSDSSYVVKELNCDTDYGV